MDDRPATPTASVYAANLQQTLKELRKKVQECEGQLSELRSKQQQQQQHQIPQTPAGQIQTLVAAFDDVANSEPLLPYPGSVLPALLALRKTHQTIAESRAFLASQAEATEAERRRRDAENATLRDHELLRQALAERIGTLRAAEADDARSRAGVEAEGEGEARPEDAARKRAEEMQDRKKHYRRETSRLMRALDRFINDHLAAMLAAEELGGPVVGDLMDVDPEDLVAGFNAQGKRKKKKHKEEDDSKGDDKRQRRIDEIWGRPETTTTTRGYEEEQQQQQQQQTDEVRAAAAEMRRLTEDLLNRLVEAGGNGSESYVRLQRESAAARFLIRSKVAEFHPKGAMRIRLVDFGRELED
ncbi:hypothetical protein ESCO_004809 [Escovopsis weberi]|uniref:Uncharacterized protein n=1 Tax=Escovopsis weberi TaxID=150374 RepID=A0A0M8MPP1_ESCWE|nr:hypothetical protein ESCO_004809 [Escovopsis weberi]